MVCVREMSAEHTRQAYIVPSVAISPLGIDQAGQAGPREPRTAVDDRGSGMGRDRTSALPLQTHPTGSIRQISIHQPPTNA
jgi:hypothetical protein